VDIGGVRRGGGVNCQTTISVRPAPIIPTRTHICYLFGLLLRVWNRSI